MTASRPLRYPVCALAISCVSAIAVHGATEFVPVPDAGLPALDNASVSWCDFDGDRRLDLLIAGGSPSGYHTHLLRRDGDSFQEVVPSLPGFIAGDAAWGDFDGDGDPDLALSGLTASGRHTGIYRNDGSMFAILAADLEGLGHADVDWGDADNDGDLDLLAVGQLADGLASTTIYRNDGGVFFDSGITLPGAYQGSSGWCDHDGDGRLDLFISGYSDDFGAPIAMIYRSTGNGFQDVAAGLPGVMDGAHAWIDADLDGDQDLVLTGTLDWPYDNIAKFFRNDGDAFTEVALGPAGIRRGSIACGDCDNDGDPDLLLTGVMDGVGEIANLYRNAAGVFSQAQVPWPGLDLGDAAWADYDLDGDLDIALVGHTGSQLHGGLYRNDTTPANTPPTPPSALTGTWSGNRLTLTWSGALDTPAPTAALTYNLRLGTAPGGNDVMSAMSATDGFRRVPTSGNAGTRLSWEILVTPPPPVTYCSVQAVDGSFAGGPFTPEITVSVPPTGAEGNHASGSSRLTNSPNPFNPGTMVVYALDRGDWVRVAVYDLSGRLVRLLMNGPQSAGDHAVRWDGKDETGQSSSAGEYVCVLESGNRRESRLLTIIR